MEMLPLFAGLGIAFAFSTPQAEGEQSPIKLKLPATVSESRLELLTYTQAADRPRICPKHRWEYPFRSLGYAESANGSEAPELRFRVYAQSQKDVATMVAVNRMLLRLWDLCKLKLRLDHSLLYGRTIDVFLAEGGEAGGEQGIFEGPGPRGQLRKFNTIYIYNLASFSDPVEMAREVAHEYGHAVLPAIGGFVEPEDWGNGFLGERLFLSWLSREINSGSLITDDAMGVKAEELITWVEKNAVPLTDKIWLHGPDLKALGGTSETAMNEYLGLLLFTDEAFQGVMHRAIRLTGGMTAMDALEGVLKAVEERTEWKVAVPERLKGRDLYLPFRGAWSFEGASLIVRRGDWVKVRPERAAIVAFRKVSVYLDSFGVKLVPQPHERCALGLSN